MSRRSGLAMTVVVTLGLMLWLAPAAWAACHRFSLEVSPTSASEGDTVTVTVGRDASVADSSVQVSASDGTAQSGSDFDVLDARINFTGESVEESVTFDILDDGEAESSETFTVGLSDPGGCDVNPNFSLADDVTVTIAADEGPAEEPAEEEIPAEEEPAEEAPEEEEAEEEDGGGLATGLIVAAVVVIIVAGGFLIFRRRS